jgi:hypothetical protein
MNAGSLLPIVLITKQEITSFQENYSAILDKFYSENFMSSCLTTYKLKMTRRIEFIPKPPGKETGNLDVVELS